MTTSPESAYFLILLIFLPALLAKPFGKKKLQSFSLFSLGVAHVLVLPGYFFSYLPFLFFILFPLGYVKVDAFSTNKIKITQPVKTLFQLTIQAYFFFFAILYIQFWYNGFTFSQFPEVILVCMFLFTGIIIAYFSDGLLCAIGSIFVKKKQHYTGRLIAVDMEVIKYTRGFSISFITLFENSSDLFVFPYSYYHLIKKKTNAVFSYTVNYCIWNIIFISDLKLIDATEAHPASFETVAHKKT